MKKLFSIILCIYLGFHILIPVVYYAIFGFRYQYYYVPENYMYLAALLQSIAIILALIAINFSKKGNEPLTVQTECPVWAYYFAFFISLASLFYANNFQGVLAGKLNGTFFGYFSLFFSVDVLFIVFFFRPSKTINKVILCLSYLFLKLYSASRSAPFLILIYLLCGIAFYHGNKINKKLKRNLIISVLLLTMVSPLVFYLASSARGLTKTTKSVTALSDQIISRLSAPELGGVYLYQYENKIYNKKLFQEKYSLANQLELTINALVPGDVFKSDVDPNQYVRAIFMGWNEEACRLNYTSMNLTLPIYLVIKYSLVLGILMCVAILYLLFRLCSRYYQKLTFVVIGVSAVYNLLYFFDWVMILRSVFSIFLTILILNWIPKLKRNYKMYLRNIMLKWRK